MLPKDRTALRNLLIALVASTSVALVIGTSCLGRSWVRTVTTTTTLSVRDNAYNDSSKASAGGLPDEAVGTTTLTSAISDEAGASATGSPDVAPTATLTAPPAPVPTATATPSIPPMSIAPVPATEIIEEPAASEPSTISVSDASAAPPPAETTTGWGPTIPPIYYRTPTQGLEAGAGPFLSEPSPWAASAFTSNPEAGAGPFMTEWNLNP